jgi:2-polyprenyl-3-methyl-5-hydroxy-6-metoxy-1,4-benzoquinol methylase
MTRIFVPNLFMLVGQPDNGKTSLSNWFEKLLACEILHTDQIYHAWIAKNYPAQLKPAKQNIRGHYPRMTKEWQREWHEYVVNEILQALARAQLDVVVEGWLMLYLPEDLLTKIDQHATVMTIHMKSYHAHAAQKSLKPQGRDYTNVVTGLCSLMAQSRGVSFMRRLVRYQSFEDIRDFQGTSDSCGKMLALNLPADLTGKTVLDVGCGTGYFAIRCHQRGAQVTGFDMRYRHVKTAAKLASAVYRTTAPSFYHCNLFDWEKPEQYDYVLAVNLLSSVGPDYDKVFSRLFSWVKPGGMLVVEAAVSCVKPNHPQHQQHYVEKGRLQTSMGIPRLYPNEVALVHFAEKFQLTYRGRSTRMHGDKRRRVYHFQKSLEPAILQPHDTTTGSAPEVLGNDETHSYSEPVFCAGTSTPREEFAGKTF